MRIPRSLVKGGHWRLLLLVLAWAGFMMALASTPSPSDPSGEILSNLVHTGQYTVLVILLASFACSVLPRCPLAVLLAFVAVAGVLFGAGQEWYQSFLPHRTADPGDVLFDAAGVAAGLLLWQAGFALRRRRAQRALVAG